MLDAKLNDPALFIERLAIIGVGLIGGSLALALRAAGAVGEVVGAGRSRDNLEAAVRHGVIDRYETDLRAAVAGAGVVVVATPVGAVAQVFRDIVPALADQAVLTDVGSVKGAVVTAARAELGGHLADFVPGHPVAGTEHSGVAAAFAGLYRQHRVILTPATETRSGAIELVRRLWQACGAEVLEMDATDHDRVLAATSHLPHALAYALVHYLAQRPDSDRYFQLAAGGFYDFTRIASSDPTMWRDIFLANPAEVAACLRCLSSDLTAMADVMQAGDGERLFCLLRDARAARTAVGRHRETPVRGGAG